MCVFSEYIYIYIYIERERERKTAKYNIKMNINSYVIF